jgi:hypothetical protein
MRYWRKIAALAAVLSAVACTDDPLEVRNLNNPDTERVLTTPGDVEQVIGSSFSIIHSGHYNSADAQWPQLLVMGLENLSPNANFNMGPRGAIPRNVISNFRGRQNAAADFRDFQFMQRAARFAASALARLNSGLVITPRSRELRARAFAHFVIGVASGDVGLTYDSAAIVDERTPVTEVLSELPPLSPGEAVVAAGIRSLDSAIATASLATGANAFVLPSTWISGHTAFNQDSLIRVARSYRARFRAAVHRDSTSRKDNTDWAAVIADATNGLTQNFEVTLSLAAGWGASWFGQMVIFDNWHQMPYHFLGWADTSGGYDAWLATDVQARNAAKFIILTRDLRLPQGNTRAAQVASSNGGLKNSLPFAGRYFHHHDPGLDFGNLPYGESFYWHVRWLARAIPTIQGAWPIMTKAEVDMLAAEGYLRTGNVAAAVALINTYRTRNGLVPIPAGGGIGDPVPGGLPGCIPRVPAAPNFTSTRCGNLFEAMKYEKRLETAYSGWAMWYLDGRGWGDLPEGTALHFPVPQQELDTRALPLYELGGVGGTEAAPRGNYGF